LRGCETGRCGFSGFIGFIGYLFLLILALPAHKVEAGFFPVSRFSYHNDFPGYRSAGFDSSILFIRTSYENIFEIEGLNLNKLSVFYTPGECLLGCDVSSLSYLDLYYELYISFHVACALDDKRIYLELNPVFMRQEFSSAMGKKSLGLYVGAGINIGSIEATLIDRISGSSYRWHELSCHLDFQVKPCVVSISIWKYLFYIEVETMVLASICDRFCISGGYRLMSDMILVSTCIKASALMFEMGTLFHPVLGVSVEVGVGWNLWVKS